MDVALYQINFIIIIIIYPKSQLGSSPLRIRYTNLHFLATPDTCAPQTSIRMVSKNFSIFMKNCNLKFNADKTEFISIGTPTQRSKLDVFSTYIF